VNADIQGYLEKLSREISVICDGQACTLHDLVDAGLDKSVPHFIANEQTPGQVALSFVQSLNLISGKKQ
jgi:hypothetical protein